MPSLRPSDTVTRNCDSVSMHCMPSLYQFSCRVEFLFVFPELLAKLMVNEYACVSDMHNVKKGKETTESLKMVKIELELKAAELEIRRMNQRQDCNFTRRYSRFSLQRLETASTFLMTPSEHSRDDIKILSDAVNVTDSEEARGRFAG
nr:hypothetical protein [Tanacetum cinerariifolium]